ncbi:MAG: type VI secretion system membrane subunit TssM [Pseudomonadota bacterium]
MKKIWAFLLSTPFLVLFFTAVIAASIWFLGPVMGAGGVYPLESALARVLTIAGLFMLAIIVILVVLLRRRSREAGLAEDIAGGPAIDPSDAAAAAELGELKNRMREAMTMLRRARLGGRFGRRHLYQLPWYIIIGPPGAGKTTAIANSGLQFPLADRMGLSSIGGVGGTRNCDWWFTNEAVLIDTAGRYTTQDSDETADARAWSGFLDLLKKYRKRQPINGAVIAISLSDISLFDEATRRSHAGAIRMRLAELRARLGVRFPVYVLFTKADLIAGFQEFFEPLGREGRQQVWGFTLPMPPRGGQQTGPALEGFAPAFQGLLDRLNDQALERMQSETNAERRSLVQAFPQQVASLRDVAHDFLSAVFQDSRFEERQLLRGVYFASGTQEGTPIDRLMMGMARSFGIGRQAIGSGQGQARSFFLGRLLQGVIFGEAGLVSADDKVERRYRWVVRGGITAAMLVLIGVGALWTVSFIGNRALVAEARTELEGYQTALAEIDADPALSLNPVADGMLDAVVDPLDLLRSMPGNPAQDDPDPPVELTWGLYQGDRIGTEAAQTYRAALNQLLLPRLLFRLEDEMVQARDAPEALFTLLKAYLMLGQKGPMDRDFLVEWFEGVSNQVYPGFTDEDRRLALIRHFSTMINAPMREIALDGDLVAEVQGILAQTPVAVRVYKSIVNSPAAQALSDWRIIAAGGPNTTYAMLRRPPEPISGGVPGIYTYTGFQSVFLPEAGAVAARIQRESWILGDAIGDQIQPENLPNIARDVLDLYLNDYVLSWERILGELEIVPINDLGSAVEVTNILSGPTSPIANILKSISDETKLTEKRAPFDAETAAADASEFAVEEALLNLTARQQTFFNLIRRAAPGVELTDQDAHPGQYVEDQFAWLHALTRAIDGQPSRLSQLLKRINDVYQELNGLSLGSNQINLSAQRRGTAEQLLEATGRMPNPLQRWAQQVALDSIAVLSGGVRDRLSRLWQSRVLPVCRRLEGRYPLDANARSDANLADFARLFGIDGEIDKFFNENILGYVDMTNPQQWAWVSAPGKDLGMPQEVLAMFQSAAIIRDAFFLAPGMPSMTFDIEVSSLDPSATRVILLLEGQELVYSHGPDASPIPMTWPGRAGGRTSVTLLPETPPTSNILDAQGRWAIFRLFQKGRRHSTQATDEFTVRFTVGGRRVLFNVKTGAAYNPFNLPQLNQFRCLPAL